MIQKVMQVVGEGTFRNANIWPGRGDMTMPQECGNERERIERTLHMHRWRYKSKYHTERRKVLSKSMIGGCIAGMLLAPDGDSTTRRTS